MSKILIGLVFVLVVVSGFYFLGVGSNLTGSTVNGEVKTFVVDSSHLRFYIDGVENPEIRVKEGDKVRIDFASSEGYHDWVLDEFNASTERVGAGNSTFVEFVADKKGTYEYYCSVGKHRENGMKGIFVVE